MPFWYSHGVPAGDADLATPGLSSSPAGLGSLPNRQLGERIVSQDLKPGDRVRLTADCRVSGYGPGECGRVLWVSRASPGGPVTLYHVEMDRTGPSSVVALYPIEVEPED